MAVQTRIVTTAMKTAFDFSYLTDIFILFFETESCYIAQAGLTLGCLSHLSAGIRDVNHHA
jgi:hypothetical protein